MIYPDPERAKRNPIITGFGLNRSLVQQHMFFSANKTHVWRRFDHPASHCHLSAFEPSNNQPSQRSDLIMRIYKFFVALSETYRTQSKKIFQKLS